MMSHALLPALFGLIILITSLGIGRNPIASFEDLMAHLKPCDLRRSDWTFRSIFCAWQDAGMHLQLVEAIERSARLIQWDKDLEYGVRDLKSCARCVRRDAWRCLYSCGCRRLVRDYDNMVRASHYLCMLLRPELLERLEEVL